MKNLHLDFLKSDSPRAFSPFSESDTVSYLRGWLAGLLAGWLQRGPMRNNRRKENLHTHTSKFQTVADGFNSSAPFFHNLSGNLLPASGFVLLLTLGKDDL